MTDEQIGIGTKETTQIIEREQKESMKLSVSTKGVYTWEIKILPEIGNALLDVDFERLKKRNDMLKEAYGSN